MDPIALIVTALVTGATEALRENATEGLKDAYRGLRALVQKRFSGKPEAEMALTQVERKPETWQAPLSDALKETAVDRDREIVQAAQRLMQLMNPEQAVTGKYNVQIAGDVQGFAQGDHQHVEMTFGEKH